MPKATEIAAELQKIVDKLNQNPEQELTRPSLYWSGFYGDKAKEDFINVVKILPRPLKKDYTDYDVDVKYQSDALYIRAEVSRDKICEIISPAQPAKYHCESLLNETEDAELIED